jgi:hypothetical protein
MEYQMENLGERLVGDYLRYIKQCDFVDFNVYTTATQGEIDVIGVSNINRAAFICEVVTHLTTGIQYTKNARPDTADRLIRKFTKDIQYGKDAFFNWSVDYMLWSPVVRRSNGSPKYDQFVHLKQMTEEIFARTGVKITLIINKDYVDAIDALRFFARNETKELKSPVMRFLQIDEWSRKNLKKITAA